MSFISAVTNAQNHMWQCLHTRVSVCTCVSLGVIKVIDSLGSITRVGVATVTFGRKCHFIFNDASDNRPYFGALFQYRCHV